MRRHVTLRFWVCLAVAVLGFAFTVNNRGSFTVLALSGPFILAVALSAVDGWWPEVSVFDVNLDKTQMVEGDNVNLDFTVGSDRHLGWVEVEVQLSTILSAQAPSRFLLSLAAGEKRRLTIPLQAERWGVAGPEWITIITQDRFGISQNIMQIPVYESVQIYPAAEKLKSLVPLYKERQVTGEHRSRVKGAGSELAEAREYRQGDPIRMIHARLSARAGKPIVLERHPERSSTVVLMVDSAQDLGGGMDTSLRWTVTAIKALTERHLLAQDQVGLLDIGNGLRWVSPRLGRRQLYTLVSTLLATEAAATIQPYIDPPPLPKSATVVAVSPMLSQIPLMTLMELRTRGHPIVVLKPATMPSPPGLNPLAERLFKVGIELNERWLTERGSIVIPWGDGKTLEQMMQQVSQVLARSRHMR